jgi:hypothetical protein
MTLREKDAGACFIYSRHSQAVFEADHETARVV